MRVALLARKVSRTAIDAYARIGRRVALLVFLGLMANGILKLEFENLRMAGVLQRYLLWIVLYCI